MSTATPTTPAASYRRVNLDDLVDGQAVRLTCRNGKVIDGVSLGYERGVARVINGKGGIVHLAYTDECDVVGRLHGAPSERLLRESRGMGNVIGVEVAS